MTHITLSIPEELYRLMKKHREINWSEVARRAIIEKLLAIKAGEEGLTREELAMLLEATGRRIPTRSYDYSRELKLLEKSRKKRGEELNISRSWRSIDTGYIVIEKAKKRGNKRKHNLNHFNRISTNKDYEKLG